MKTRHIIALTGILLFFAGSVFVLHKVSSALQQKEEQYATFPVFSLPDIDGNIVSDASIDRNKGTVFYFFDPDCSLCVVTLDSLRIRHMDFSDHQIMLITLVSQEKITEFLGKMDFMPPENIKILFDENADLISLMDIKGAPSSLIYKEGRLAKRFDGPVTVETLIKYLQ